MQDEPPNGKRPLRKIKPKSNLPLREGVWDEDEIKSLRELCKSGWAPKQIASKLHRTLTSTKAKIVALRNRDIDAARMVENNSSRTRQCLKCKSDFSSRGNHNRLCDDCREKIGNMGVNAQYYGTN